MIHWPHLLSKFHCVLKTNRFYQIAMPMASFIDSPLKGKARELGIILCYKSGK